MRPKDAVLDPDLSLNELLKIGTNPSEEDGIRIEAFNALGEHNFTLSLQQEVFKSLMESPSSQLRCYCYRVLTLGAMNGREKLISGTNGLGFEWTMTHLIEETDPDAVHDAFRARLQLGDPTAPDFIDRLCEGASGKTLENLLRLKEKFQGSFPGEEGQKPGRLG